jgi:hypothetical protein
MTDFLTERKREGEREYGLTNDLARLDVAPMFSAWTSAEDDSI